MHPHERNRASYFAENYAPLERAGVVDFMEADGEVLPGLEQVVAAHLAGTRYGIRVDPADGLITQGAPGVALTTFSVIGAGTDSVVVGSETTSTPL